MKTTNTRWLRCFGYTLFLLLLAGMVVPGEAQIFFLNDANSLVTIDASAPAPVGMTSYQVNGIQEVRNQWFYYRIGNLGPENPIEAIGGLTFSQSNARTLDLTYANAQYSARIVYTLTGGALGSGQSSLNQSITFLNKSTSSDLSLHFYDYSDFDLDATSAGQSLQFLTTAAPTLRTNKFTQTFGSSWLTTSLSSGTNFPSHVEAALYNQTLAKLLDANPTTLNDVLGPVLGDVTGTFQWDVTLPPEASLSISKLITMQVTLVPEPSMVGLLALGLIATIYRKCRTR